MCLRRVRCLSLSFGRLHSLNAPSLSLQIPLQLQLEKPLNNVSASFGSTFPAGPTITPVIRHSIFGPHFCLIEQLNTRVPTKAKRKTHKTSQATCGALDNKYKVRRREDGGD